MAIVYKLYCVNNYGDYEENGFFFSKENAQIEKNIIDKQPGNVKYGIKQFIEEISIEGSQPKISPELVNELEEDLKELDLDKLIEEYKMNGLGMIEMGWDKFDYDLIVKLLEALREAKQTN